MTFADILTTCLLKGGTARRASEPHIEYDLDAAEGLRWWSMNSETDDLLEHSFDAVQCCANDWEVAPCPK